MTEGREHVRLQVLGPVAVEPALSGPRRIAVLVYLALARPHGLHSRDTLIALLWPDADQAGGRHALRNALHALKRALGPVIVTSGDAMVGVDAELLECDALDLEGDLAAGRYEQALARYHGEVLQGFFVSDAPEFEHWLDGERRRLSDAARSAAWGRAEALRTQGDTAAAMAAARRAAALAPDDEVSVRRLLTLLEEGGDRAAAMRVYEEFAALLRNEYDAAPSAETQALAQSLREQPSAAELRAAAPTARPRIARGGTPPDTNEGSSVAPIAAGRRGWPWMAATTLAVGVVVSIGIAARRSSVPDESKRVVVLPMENQTGDSSLEYVASGIAEGVGQRLEGLGGLHVLSAARSESPDSIRHDVRGAMQQYRAGLAVRSSLSRIGDSLEVRASLIQSGVPDERVIAASRFALADVGIAERDIVASTAAALFRTPMAEVPRADARAVDPESYRLTMRGFYELLRVHDHAAARESFERATALDPLNARAFAGLSSTYGSQAASAAGGTGAIFDEVVDRAEASALRAVALDSMQGTAWANLGFVRALKERNLSVGLPLIAKAERVDPSNPEVFLVAAALYRHAWRWDEALDEIRVARRLDPLSPYYLDREATIDVCADRIDAALHLFDQELAMSPMNDVAIEGRARTLALLGRPAPGYWDDVRERGRRRVAKLRKQGTVPLSDSLKLMQAEFAAGDTANAFALTDSIAARGDRNLYKLPCMPDLDQLRGNPHLAAIIQRVGALPADAKGRR